MSPPRLYMVLMGSRPKGRLTEQHDVFFGIATSLKELVPAMKRAWPEAKGLIHVDAWREVTQIGNFKVEVKTAALASENKHQLYFINLGGYKPGEFEEYHYKLIVAAPDKGSAIQQSKKTAFYKHYGFKGATSHVDDKYGIDIDDIHEIKDILSEEFKSSYMLSITEHEAPEDEIHIGYFKLDKL